MTDYRSTFLTNFKNNNSLYDQQEVTEAINSTAEQAAQVGAEQGGMAIAKEALSPDNQNKVKAQYKQGIVQSIPLGGGQK